MASADKELEDSLMEAGRRLFSPPSDTEELLFLLDITENYLSKVDQSPSPSIFAALRPVREALVAKDLLRHSNLEVKVAMASCLSEIIRITAPDSPYDDDRMKVIFQTIVESFEKLDDISSRSFPKRVSILETVAKVRSCLVMLDLECNALIFDMFWFFLKTIRPNHPVNVFSSMELIMSLVLEESEDISSELISCLLYYVKKDNKEVLPAAHRLGEKVISNSAARLKPYLVQAQSLPGSYSKIVASICQVDDSKLSERTVSDELPQISGIAEDVDQQQKLDESIVGSKIKVWWPDDERFYYGRVDSFDPSNEKHTIVYVGDEVEVLLLKEEHFELLEIEEGQLEDVPSTFDSPEVVPSNKKVKANPGGSSKKGKKKALLKSDEHASGAASKPKSRPPRKSKDTPASQVNDETPEITAPDSDDEHGSGAVKSLAGKPKGRRPKKSKETPASTSLRTIGLDSGVLKSSTGKPKGQPSKILKETPLSKSEYETPKTVSSKIKGSGRKSNEDTPELAIKDEDEMEYTAAATHTTGVRKSKDFPPKAVMKSNDDTPRTYSKVKRDTPKMCSKSMDVDTPLSSVKYKDVSLKFSSKSTDVDPPKFSGKFKDASVKSSSKSVDVDPPRSSGKYKDGSVKSSGKSIGVDAPKTIDVAPKSSSGKYKDGLVKSSSKFIGETPKSIVDAPKSFGKYKESSMKSHSKSMDLDSPKSSGKHNDASGKASIKPMDIDIPKSSVKSKDGSMKTSDGTAKGGPKTKPKGDVIPRTVGDESAFDGSSEKGKGKVRAGETSETESYETQTLAEIQASLGLADNSRKRKARK